jgi:hypothetical protein
MKEKKENKPTIYATTETVFPTVVHSQSVTVDKTTKEKANILIHNVPCQSEFPGGTDWKNEEGEKCENPYWRMAVNYMLYYEFGARRREGEREFTALQKPAAKERGPVQMKPETLLSKLAEAFEADPLLEVKQAAERYQKRKGCDYATAYRYQLAEFDMEDEEWEARQQEQEA